MFKIASIRNKASLLTEALRFDRSTLSMSRFYRGTRDTHEIGGDVI